MDLTNFEDKIPPKKVEVPKKTQAEVQNLADELVVEQPHKLIDQHWYLYVEFNNSNASIISEYSSRKPVVTVAGNLISVSAPQYDYVFSADAIKFMSVKSQ